MKLVENPKRVGRVLSAIIIIAILVQAINFFASFLNSSGSQSTEMNTFIMYLCIAVIMGSIAIALVINVTGKQNRK